MTLSGQCLSAPEPVASFWMQQLRAVDRGDWVHASISLGMFRHRCQVGNREGCRFALDWGMLVPLEAPRDYKNVERSNANEHSFFLVCVDLYEVQDVLEMLP